MYPHLNRCVDKERMLYTNLLKNLYRCVQSSKLRFGKLSRVLKEDELEQKLTNPFLFQKKVKN